MPTACRRLLFAVAASPCQISPGLRPFITLFMPFIIDFAANHTPLIFASAPCATPLPRRCHAAPRRAEMPKPPAPYARCPMPCATRAFAARLNHAVADFTLSPIIIADAAMPIHFHATRQRCRRVFAAGCRDAACRRRRRARRAATPRQLPPLPLLMCRCFHAAATPCFHADITIAAC